MYREAFERLPDYLRKPNNESLYYVGYGGMSELRDSFYDIQDSRNIDEAFGQTLDYLGGNVGQPRPPGMSDEEYRLRIKVKIIANRSDGDIPTINHVASNLFGDQYLGLHELWDSESDKNEPAAVMLHLQPPFNFGISETVNMVVSGGVRIYWSITFKQANPDIFIGVYSLTGEEVVVYPSIAKDPEIYPKLYIGAFYEGIAETITLENFEEQDDINIGLDVRNLGNLINQLEQITLYSDKGGGEDV